MFIWSSLAFDNKKNEHEKESFGTEQPRWSVSTKNVGVDLGYGFVKILNGDEEVIFPSVVGSGSQLKFRSGLKSVGKPTENMMIEIDGKTYFVGNLAIKQSEIASRSLDQDRVEDLNTRVLLLTGLGLLSQWDNQEFNLVTGLPTSYFAGYSDEWDSKLKGNYRVKLTFGANDQEKRFKVREVKMIPQPFGTLYDQLLSDQGIVVDNDLANMRVGIVDIGFKTTDFAVADEMEFVERESSCSTIALSSAYKIIAKELRDEHKVDKENFELDKIIEKGQIRLAGQKIDLMPIKQTAFEQVAMKIITELESIWDYRDLDKILLTGGGGQALASFLLPRFPNMQLVKNSQFANTRGYQKLAASAFK